MDQFVTTYRKDYLWPYVRSFGHKRVEFEDQPAVARRCECQCFHPTKKHLLQPDEVQDQNWSRLGPMGPLLDPKLYPVKVGKPPESATMRSGQPNRFLAKLQEKYPFLYDIIKSSPPSDLIARVNKDRFMTTYQIDYCSPEAIPDYFARAQDFEGIAPCPEPSRLPGDTYRPNQKESSKAQRFNTLPKSTISGGGKGMGSGKAEASKCTSDNGGGSSGVWTFNKSEYQDGISKLGALIIRDQLHVHNSQRAK